MQQRVIWYWCFSLLLKDQETVSLLHPALAEDGSFVSSYYPKEKRVQLYTTIHEGSCFLDEQGRSGEKQGEKMLRSTMKIMLYIVKCTGQKPDHTSICIVSINHPSMVPLVKTYMYDRKRHTQILTAQRRLAFGDTATKLFPYVILSCPYSVIKFSMTHCIPM